MWVLLTAQQFISCSFHVSFISNLEKGSDILLPAFLRTQESQNCKEVKKKLSVFKRLSVGKWACLEGWALTGCGAERQITWEGKLKDEHCAKTSGEGEFVQTAIVTPSLVISLSSVVVWSVQVWPSFWAYTRCGSVKLTKNVKAKYEQL